jgi:GDP-L-fucose synthase
MDVETVKADLFMKEDCLNAVKGMDIIFHAAGAVSAAGTTVNNPISPVCDNLVLTSRVLEAAVAEGVDRCLIFSSSTAYPEADHPIKEDEMWLAEPYKVYFGYGWMRRYLEKLGQFISLKSKVKIALVRPTAVYGRWDDFDPVTSHVIPGLIRRALSKEDPYVVWGNGNEVRDFLHVSDLERGCADMIEKIRCLRSCKHRVREKTVTIKEIVDLTSGFPIFLMPRWVYDTSKPSTITFQDGGYRQGAGSCWDLNRLFRSKKTKRYHYMVQGEVQCLRQALQ